MRTLFAAASLLCLAAPAARAQALLPDAAFAARLAELGAGLQADIRGALVVRKAAGELSKEDAARMVLARLAGSGVPEDYVRAAFDDPATRLYPDIPDRFRRGESPEERDYEEYRRRFITEARIRAGVEFYLSRGALLGEVEGRYGVDRGILTSLLGVETFYGTKTGTYMVFSALYTIVLKVPRRSEWAAGELAEWLKLCHRDRVAPHSILGSYAGAFGYHQFIPSSFNRLAVDYDGDGRRRFNDWPDVLGSVSNYLRMAGWEPGGPLGPGSRNHAALYAYNHSNNYVQVILELREEILKRLPPPGA